MRSRELSTKAVAKERLRLMIAASPIDARADELLQMKKEISDIVAKYLDIKAQDYEVKIIYKHNK